MVNYLLEDDDPREERTGYLYLEFKREDSPTYCTVGMGIRARRGRPLEKWYFGLHDGRRIGVDFQLYKEVGKKSPFPGKNWKTASEKADRYSPGRLIIWPM